MTVSDSPQIQNWTQYHVDTFLNPTQNKCNGGSDVKRFTSKMTWKRKIHINQTHLTRFVSKLRWSDATHETYTYPYTSFRATPGTAGSLTLNKLVWPPKLQLYSTCKHLNNMLNTHTYRTIRSHMTRLIKPKIIQTSNIKLTQNPTLTPDMNEIVIWMTILLYP